jgi:hypothetical protein
MARRRGASREGDAGDEGMARERRAAGISEPGNDVDDASGKARLMDQTGKLEERRGSFLRCLQDDRAAGRECRTELDGGQKELRIPRDNGGDDPDRFAPEKSFHICFIDREVSAFQLIGKAAEITVVIGDVADLRSRLTDDLSSVAGFEFRKAGGVLCDKVAKAEEQSSPLRRGQPRPIWIGERAVGGGNTARSTSCAVAAGMTAQARAVAGSTLSNVSAALTKSPSI